MRGVFSVYARAIGHHLEDDMPQTTSKLIMAGGLMGAALAVADGRVFAYETCEMEDYICTAQLGSFQITSCSGTSDACAFMCYGPDYWGTCYNC